ncbi:MAG: hypothetical protein QOJ64_1904 [Acidobacteriota bacterium]|jgi:CSLREA domain-containing protein|nr:hypothetical protein [Acidobacteriota bacterium]
MKRISLKNRSAYPVRSMIVLAVLIAGAAFVFSLQAAYAATTYTVNSLADTDDSICDAANCTLREAINAAEGNAGADTIDFSVNGTITLGSTLPSITDDMTITGPGASLLTVSGNNSVRVFNVDAGTVTFAQLTISNGRSGSGGGISFGSAGAFNVTNCILSGNTASGGGAISNGGALNITNSILSNNTGAFGGAIANVNQGTATIDSSTISGNYSADSGGGIWNNATLDVIASTVSNNSAAVGGGGITNFGILNVINSTLSGNSAGEEGGGIWTYETARIISSTVTDNSGSGILIYNGTVELGSSIVALNTPNDAGGCVSQGHNVVGDPSGFNPTPTDQVGVTAAQLNLGPLANNGGPTQTRALGTGSVAIDNGDDTVTLPPLSLTTDQRGPGYARKSGTHVDVGAFEVQQANAPTNANQCKNGGWRNFDTPRTFKNQGDCIQFVNTGK